MLFPTTVVKAPVGMTQKLEIAWFAVAAPATPMAPLPVNVNEVIAFVPDMVIIGNEMFVAPATDDTVAMLSS
jgi:hypothetical protein